jgi:hypothetical protein
MVNSLKVLLALPGLLARTLIIFLEIGSFHDHDYLFKKILGKGHTSISSLANGNPGLFQNTNGLTHYRYPIHTLLPVEMYRGSEVSGQNGFQWALF